MQTDNRGFLYGDGLFETIKVSNRRPFNLDNHYQRLHKGLKTLRLLDGQQSFSFNDFKLLLEQQIEHSSEAHLRIRLSFYRVQGGFYSPSQTNFNVVAQCLPLPNSTFELNERGLRIGLCQSVRLVNDSLSSLKTISALSYVKAGIEKKEQGWDDALLMNAQNALSESIASNLFLIKKNQLFTPSLDQACVAGTMRALVLQLLKNQNLSVQEKPLSLDAIKQADSVFLTNAIQGIQWVAELHDEALFTKNKLMVSLTNRLNQSLSSNNTSL